MIRPSKTYAICLSDKRILLNVNLRKTAALEVLTDLPFAINIPENIQMENLSRKGVFGSAERVRLEESRESTKKNQSL